MQSIEIRKGVRVEIEDLISSVAKMDTPALEKFLDTLNQILNTKKTGADTGHEKELLERIENMIPAFVKRRYVQLQAKLEEGTISEVERLEIRQISDYIEEKTIERVHLMAELAALRQVSVKEVAEQLRQKRYGNVQA